MNSYEKYSKDNLAENDDNLYLNYKSNRRESKKITNCPHLDKEHYAKVKRLLI